MGAGREQHVSVLKDEVLEHLDIRPDGIYLDGTFGRGGHSRALLERLGPEARLVVVDRDPQAVVGILIGGQVKLTGDSAKLLSLAGMAGPPTEGSEGADLAREVIRRIDEVTARHD